MFNIWDESCWKQSKVGVLSSAVGEGDDNYDGQAKKKSFGKWGTHLENPPIVTFYRWNFCEFKTRENINGQD